MSEPLQAPAIFAQYLIRSTEEPGVFERLCSEHPGEAEELRRLRAKHERSAGSVPCVDDAVTVRLRRRLEAPADEPELPAAATMSGRYLLLDEVGRGGMGVVLRVWDTVMERSLAMKVLAADTSDNDSSDDSKGVVRRFVDEARLAGRLEHPGVVPVHDLYVDPDGQVFFTMPMIEGLDLSEVFDRVARGDAGWSSARAIGIILQVCEIVGYAHSHGVVHRDLTPGNVRVGTFGEIYVIDWGLAKVVGRTDRKTVRRQLTPLTDKTEGDVTLAGTVMGTPSYMPPEQAEGRVDDISFASDIYAVGAMLYRLLTGRAPYSDPKRTTKPQEIVQLVRRGPPPQVESLASTVPAEVAAICAKAMQRDPNDRYPSMAAMAEDLRAFLEGRVVRAYQYGPLAEFWKLVLRNRGLSIAIGSAVLVAVVSLLTVTWVHMRVNQQLEASNERLRSAHGEALQAAYDAGVVGADGRIRGGDISGGEAQLMQCPDELRGWEWRHLLLRAEGSLTTLANPSRGPALATCLGSAGSDLLVGRQDGKIEVWDLAHARHLRTVDAGTEAAAGVAAYDDTRLYVRGAGGWLRVVDGTAGGSRILVESGVVAMHGTSDGVLTCHADGSVKRWQAESAVVALAGSDAEIARASFSADGSWVATLDRDQQLSVRDLVDGETKLQMKVPWPVSSMAVTAVRGLIATADDTGAVRVLDANAGGELADVRRDHQVTITALSFLADGSTLVSADRRGAIQVWNLVTGATDARTGHRDSVTGVWTASREGLIVSCAADATVRVWSGSAAAHVTHHSGFGSAFRCARFDANAERVVAGTVDGFVLVRNENTEQVLDLWRHEKPITDVALVGSTTVFALASDGELLRAVTGTDSKPVAVGGAAPATSLAPAQNAVFVAHRDGTVSAWSETGVEPLASWHAATQPLADIDCSDDGGRVVTLAEDGEVIVWSPSGQLVHTFGPAAATATAVAVCDEGVAVGYADGTVSWRTIDGEAALELRSRGGAVTKLDFAPGGSRLVSGGEDGRVIVWNLTSGRRLLVLDDVTDAVAALQFDPTGQRLLTCTGRGGVRIYESTPMLERMGEVGSWSLRAFSWDPFATTLRQLQARAEVTATEKRLLALMAMTERRRAERLRLSVSAVVYDSAATASSYRSALRDIEMAAHLEPEHPEVSLLRGAALFRCNRLRAASLVLQEAVAATDPGTHLASLGFLAMAKWEQGLHDEARQTFAAMKGELGMLDPTAAETRQLRELGDEVRRCFESSQR